MAARPPPRRSSPARCRTIGARPCRHPLVRQGLRADDHPDRRERRDPPDDRALLTRRPAAPSRRSGIDPDIEVLPELPEDLQGSRRDARRIRAARAICTARVRRSRAPDSARLRPPDHEGRHAATSPSAARPKTDPSFPPNSGQGRTQPSKLAAGRNGAGAFARPESLPEPPRFRQVSKPDPAAEGYGLKREPDCRDRARSTRSPRTAEGYSRLQAPARCDAPGRLSSGVAARCLVASAGPDIAASTGRSASLP